MGKQSAGCSTLFYGLVAVMCFGMLGTLTGYRISYSLGGALVYGFIGAVGAAVCLGCLAGALYILNGQVRQQHGWRGINKAVANGFLLMVPFTILAFVADVVFGWNTTLAFLSAGIMTASAAVGAEVIKLGGGRLINLVVPTLGASAFSVMWMMFNAFVQSVGR